MLSRKLIKYIQSLKQKKFRDGENAFIAEGPKIISEFLTEKTFPCRMIVALEGWIDYYGDKSQLDGIEVLIVDEVMLSRLSNLAAPNKVLAVFEKGSSFPGKKYAKNLTLVLDSIQDPGNMGTIIRLADWYALPHIVCSDDSVECFNPKVVQAAMGSLARVEITYTLLEQYIAETNKTVYAATLDGLALAEFENPSESILIIGNESAGIRDDMAALANHRISIPKYGKAESLNAAVATGILLNEMLRVT